MTGGAGFVGSELVRQLAARGLSVVVIDSLTTGRRENLDGLLEGPVELAVADVRDDASADLLVGADLLFYLACLGVRHSIHSPQENHEVNATGTLKMLAASRRAGVKRFVYVSSSEVYGSARWIPMSEEHPTFPTTVYGASKLAAEAYVRAFFHTYGYATTIVRPFNTYGPRCHHEGDSGEVIPRMVLRALAGRPLVIFGSGRQSRDFSHVSDTARGILLAGLSDRTIGETLNLGSQSEITINELAGRVAEVSGRPAEIVYDDPRPGDTQRLCADASKAHELVGYAPQVGLIDGLRSVRDWYLGLRKPLDALLEQEVLRNWEVATPLSRPRRANDGTVAGLPVTN